MKLFTIGFSGKKARKFFNQLKENNIDCLLDVRLNNNNLYAGYTKIDTLQYILEDLMNIKYKHVTELAPTKKLFTDYKNKEVNWAEYESQYNNHIREIDAVSYIPKDADNVCLLCAEPTAEQCHRRLAAEHIQNNLDGITIKHI